MTYLTSACLTRKRQASGSGQSMTSCAALGVTMRTVHLAEAGP